MQILEVIAKFFKAEKIEYWHRDRSIEIVAAEKEIDLSTLKEEVQIIIKNEGRVAAISALRHRFHVPLSSAWRFVNKLD